MNAPVEKIEAALYRQAAKRVAAEDHLFDVGLTILGVDPDALGGLPDHEVVERVRDRAAEVLAPLAALIGRVAEHGTAAYRRARAERYEDEGGTPESDVPADTAGLDL